MIERETFEAVRRLPRYGVHVVASKLVANRRSFAMRVCALVREHNKRLDPRYLFTKRTILFLMIRNAKGQQRTNFQKVQSVIDRPLTIKEIRSELRSRFAEDIPESTVYYNLAKGIARGIFVHNVEKSTWSVKGFTSHKP